MTTTTNEDATLGELRNALARLCRDVLRPRAREVDEKRELPVENLKVMADMGLFGIEIAQEYGGLGLGVKAHAMVCENRF